MTEKAQVIVQQEGEEIIEESVEQMSEEDFIQQLPTVEKGYMRNGGPVVGSLPRPDPINDDPADFIDVVATDSPTKGPLSEKNVIRVISAAPPSTIMSLEDDDERKILEGLRKSREQTTVVRRRILVRRDPITGSLLVDKNNTNENYQENAINNQPKLSFSPNKQTLQRPSASTIADDEDDRAAEATKEFTSKLRTLKLTPKQKDSILTYAGSLVDKLITITKESKDREAQLKLEDDRLWLRNEIDTIIEKRLGAVRVNANRQFWRNEAEKFTEMALTNLLVYRESGTRKQDVLTSALAGFNMSYIHSHKYGAEIISTIKKMRDSFTENPRACRAFVDVCAEFLMNNCFEKHFPCNAEKYALLRHCEEIFDIKLDFKFFTLENGTGKLDRRIRTIRTTDYKKGGVIQRKRKPLRRSTDNDTKTEFDESEAGDQSDSPRPKSIKEEKKSPQVKSKVQKRPIPKRTWTRATGRTTIATEPSPSSSMSTRSMNKRIRLAPLASIADKKLIILTKKTISTSMVTKPTENGEEVATRKESVEEVPVIDPDNDVELPQ